MTDHTGQKPPGLTTGPEKGPIPAPGQAPTVGGEAREAAREIALLIESDEDVSMESVIQRAIDRATRAAEDLCKALEAELARLNALTLSQGHTIQAQAEEIVELRNHLITILPMAKGYAAAYPVGKNHLMVEAAALAAQDGKGEG